MNKAATIDPGFVTKGAAKSADATKPVIATPVVSVPVISELIEQRSAEQEQAMPASRPSVSTTARNSGGVTIPVATKSLTIKVDFATYTTMKQHGGSLGGKTNQDIVTEAIRMYFEAYQLKPENK